MSDIGTPFGSVVQITISQRENSLEVEYVAILFTFLFIFSKVCSQRPPFSMSNADEETEG